MRYTNYYPASGLLHVSIPKIMGTRLDALLFGDDGQILEDIWNMVENEIVAIEKMLNCFDCESEVSKVNAEAQLNFVNLSEGLWKIMLDCKRYFELTDRCFDITLSDFGRIEFVDSSRSIRFDKYGLALDFGGYGKGYALKILRSIFAEAGITRALVNFGNSSALAVGSHPFGEAWKITLAEPNNCAETVFSLRDSSLSVSGNTPARSQHIVNPATSEFCSGDMMVAVEAEDPLDAEILTTAWIVSGQEQPPEWMKNFNLKNTFRLR